METPVQLGKYVITGTLGRGAMGVVYKGFDPNILRPVALKTIRKDFVLDAESGTLAARFRNEAQAAGRLGHPGIVAVYDFGEDDEIAYIAMEYVEGHDLADYFKRGVRFSPGDAVTSWRSCSTRSTTPTATALSTATSSRRTSSSPPGPGEAGGLRHCPHDLLRPDAGRDGDGDPQLHGAGTGPSTFRRMHGWTSSPRASSCSRC